METNPIIENEIEDTQNSDKSVLFDENGKFKKGHPKLGGAVKGSSYSLIAILKRKLAETIKEKGIEAGEDLVDNWLIKAQTERGIEALKEIVHYTDGMPKQQVDITADVNQNIDLDPETLKSIDELITKQKEKL